MNRHLLPHEIDLLLDGEVGFGTAPLKVHVRRCETCRAELASARALVDELEHLPRFAPSPLFASQVMARVQVFVPWHVALLDTVRGWVPRSRPARLVAGTAAAAIAAVLTVASLWLVARLDTAVFAVNLALDRTRDTVLNALAAMVAAAFGEPVLEALRTSGVLGLTIAAIVLLAAAAVAASALRALAVGSRAR